MCIYTLLYSTVYILSTVIVLCGINLTSVEAAGFECVWIFVVSPLTPTHSPCGGRRAGREEEERKEGRKGEREGGRGEKVEGGGRGVEVIKMEMKERRN